MAVVWRAWDPKLEREVAIKEPIFTADMSPEMVADFQERFLIEGQAAARLNHESIVTVYSAEILEGRPVIVMELLEGAILTDHIRAHSLSGEDIYHVLRQLLTALSYAHAAGVVHRDVKPDNIFVTNHSISKLTDFGVAHVDKPEETEDRIIVGSPGYISPEQLRGDIADARSDLFGISVLAYEMLAFDNPFGAYSGLSRDDVLLRMSASEQLPPFEMLPHISSVIARGMRQNPEERWQNASEYLEHLDIAVNADHSALTAQKRGKPFSIAKPNVTDTMVIQARGTEIKVERPDNNKASYLIMAAVALIAMLVAIIASGSTELLAVILVAMFGAAIIWFVSNQKKSKGELADRNLEVLGSVATGQHVLRVTHSSVGTVDVSVTLPYIIGRDHTLGGFPLSDAKISRAHAEIIFQEGHLAIRDLGSSNGTFINGRQVASSEPLKPGDQIQLGDTAIEIIIP